MSDTHARFFKSLSSRSRTKILQILADKDELSVEEITKLLDIAGATVSRHLQILRIQEIVSVRRDAQNRYYSLNRPQLVQQVTAFLTDLKIDTSLISTTRDSSLK